MSAAEWESAVAFRSYAAHTACGLNIHSVNDNMTTDANGNKHISSTYYQLMQVKSTTIGKSATGPNGKSFVIGNDVTTDWKANASAGAAIFAADYHAAAAQ